MSATNHPPAPEGCVAVRAQGTYTPIVGPTLTYVRVEDVAPELARYREALETIAGDWSDGGDEDFAGRIAVEALDATHA